MDERWLLRWFSSTSAVAAAALSVGAAAAAPFYAAGPPPARTGGFNEASCVECHRSNPPNDAAGSLTIDALPRSYQPNHPYRITVVLTRRDMQSAGFQLAIRNQADAKQAGVLVPADDRTTLASAALPQTQFLQHTRLGTTLTSADTARWTFTWLAPEGGPVVLHIAANAANDDNSDLGDFIYMREFVLRPAPPQ